jgi:copper chaperone CopZ
MFSFLKKTAPIKKGEVVTFKIEGMHCPSCAMNIDGVLEDQIGVIEAKTSYQKGVTKVVYDQKKVNAGTLSRLISQTGYKNSLQT